MYSRRLKIGYFTLEGLNSFSTVFYFYYIYFFLQHEFGFGNRANLVVAALNGAVYAVASFFGGKFSERIGYFHALKLGFGMMLAALVAGTQVTTVSGQLVVMVLTDLGMCFTWPTLEALVSGGEARRGLQNMVGAYNVVWAATGSLAYFCGGAILDAFGVRSIFYAPIMILVAQLVITVWLEKQTAPIPAPHPNRASDGTPEPHPHPLAHALCFRKMAWLANPFAYVAINTVVAVIPGVAGRLGLSTTLAGFCCSVWCFARVAAFAGLWTWGGWHYRFGWLLAAFLGLVGSFAVILLVPKLAVVVLAQIVFGAAAGLIYYSSLFYSMDRSDTQGEHGGIHEAAIGLGNFAGPATGALSLYVLPQRPASSALAVTLLLLGGLGGLISLWHKRSRRINV